MPNVGPPVAAVDPRIPFATVRAPAMAFRSGGVTTRCSAGDIHERAQDFAGHLRNLGVAPRTVVSLALPDPLDQVVGFLGAVAADVVPCLLPPLLPPDEEGAWANLGLVVTGQDLTSATIDGRTRRLPDDALYVQRTSGTSGPAGGIVLSRSAVTASMHACVERGYNDPASVTVGWLPLHHDFGLVVQLLLPMTGGGRAVMLSAAEWMADPVSLLETLEAEGGTHNAMPAFGFRRILDKVDAEARYDLSSVRIMNCAAEPIPAQLMTEFRARGRAWRLSPGAVMTAYGMAEVVAGVSTRPEGGGFGIDTVSPSGLSAGSRAEPTARGRRVVALGPALSCLECQVLDDAGEVRPERVVGELAVRGSALGARLTEDGVEPLPLTATGWFRTGDIGYLADGEIHILDRIKDLIIVGGVNHHPSNLERTALDAVPLVRRAAAFGVTDPTTGTEHPVVLLERTRHALDEPAAARAARRALLEVGVAARDVRFVDKGTIAVTTSGKVRRAITRQHYLEAIAVEPTTPATDWLDIVHDMTGSDARTALAAGTPLTDLGVDSLALYELIAALEAATGATIDDTALSATSTLTDLGALLQADASAAGGPKASTDGSGPADLVGESPARVVILPSRADPASGLRGTVRRALRRGPVVGTAILPMPAGNALHRLAGHVAWHTSIRRRPGPLSAERLAVAAGHPDPEAEARTSLLANTWITWRVRAVRRSLTGKEAGRRGAAGIDVHGRSHLTPSGGRGTIVVTAHTPIARVLADLPELDGRPAVLVQGRGSTGVDRARQLRDARRALAAGGVAYLFADELEGVGGVTVEIGGRSRPVRPGVARLARDTGADVVPVFPWIDQRGKVTIDVHAPLTGATDDELLLEVGAELRGFWHQRPGNLTWNIVARHERYREPGVPLAN